MVIVGAGLGGIAAAIELSRHGFNDLTILEYLHAVAREHGVERLITTNTDVSSCTWDDNACEWTVRSSDGRTWDADALVLATGQLHQPRFPSINGRGKFARRDQDDHRARPGRASLSAVVHLQLRRDADDVDPPSRNSGLVGRLLSAQFMRWQLRDPELRRKVWPNYTFGSKRVLFSSHFLPALQRSNVKLISHAITAMTPSGVATADGVHHDVDCVIYGTSFRRLCP